MRPTIPLDAWRIAVDLDVTRAIQHQCGTPAYACECEQCRHWRAIAARALPASLFHQLCRIGITPTRPTDLYAFHRDDNGEHYRITFHIAGKLLSGPDAWCETERFGSQLRYRELAPSPDNIVIAVFPHHRTRYPAPTLPTTSTSSLIQVDLRMRVPTPAIVQTRNARSAL
jgi:hypothetical protein